MPFNMFPYSNLHEINADWLLKTVKEAAEDAATAQTQAEAAQQTAEQAAETTQNFQEDLHVGDTQRLMVYIGNDQFPESTEQMIILAAVDSDNTVNLTDIVLGAGWTKDYLSEGIIIDAYTGLLGEVISAGGNLVCRGTGLALGDFFNWATHNYVQTYTAARFLPITNPNVSGNLTATGKVSCNEVKINGNDGGIVTMGLLDHPEDHALDLSALWPEAPTTENPIIRGVRSPVEDNDAANKAYVDDKQIKRYTVTGTTPTIATADGGLYKAGEVDTLTVSSVPAEGLITIVFVSGSTPASLVLPATVVMPDTFTDILPDTRYEISILDLYGTVKTWEVP